MGVRRESEGKESCPDGQNLCLDSWSAGHCHTHSQTLLPVYASCMGALGSLPPQGQSFLHFLNTGLLCYFSQETGSGRRGGVPKINLDPLSFALRLFWSHPPMRKLVVPLSSLFQLNQYRHRQISVGKTKV